MRSEIEIHVGQRANKVVIVFFTPKCLKNYPFNLWKETLFLVMYLSIRLSSVCLSVRPSVRLFVRQTVEIFAKKLSKAHHCPAHPYATDTVVYTTLFKPNLHRIG